MVILFCGFLAGCGVCAWKVRNAPEETHATEGMSGTGGETRTGVLAWAMWFLLAACLRRAISHHQPALPEVTTVPLLWVLPLAPIF